MHEDPASRAARSALRPLLLASAVYHGAFGAAAVLAPRTAYDALATWPPYNAHFLRDIGSFYLALAVATGAAAVRRSWQVPVLALLTVHYALHTVSHVVDLGDARETWKGVATLATVAGLTLVFGWLLRAAGRPAH